MVAHKVALRGVPNCLPTTAGALGVPAVFFMSPDFPAAVFDNFRLPGAVGLARGIKKIPGILEFVIGSCEVALGFLFRPFLDEEMALEIQL